MIRDTTDLPWLGRMGLMMLAKLLICCRPMMIWSGLMFSAWPVTPDKSASVTSTMAVSGAVSAMAASGDTTIMAATRNFFIA